jgi:hypothetical protein
VNFLFVVLVVVAIIAVAVWLYIARQGDAEFEFLVDQGSEFVLTELTEQAAEFSCKIPFVNKGTQDGTIMDAYTRHLLPYEQYDGVEVYSRLELETAPRTDQYFEALIVPKGTGQTAVITVRFTARGKRMPQALAEMAQMGVDMSIDIVYQVVARSNWYISKNRKIMSAGDIARALQAKQA